MRPVARLLAAVALAFVPAAVAIASCGTDAENVEACRQIEAARCDLAPACKAGFDVDGCKRFYQDACLVGTANVDAGDVSPRVNPCISALRGCAAAGASPDPGCPNHPFAAGDAGVACKDTNGKLIDPTPCNILLHCPEVLASCAWVSKPPSSGTGGADAGGDADSGGGGSTGGSGGAAATTSSSSSSG